MGTTAIDISCYILWFYGMPKLFGNKFNVLCLESFDKNSREKNRPTVMDMFSNGGQVSTSSLSSCSSTGSMSHNLRSNSSSSSSSTASSSGTQKRSHWPFSRKTWSADNSYLCIMIHSAGVGYTLLRFLVLYPYSPFLYWLNITFLNALNSNSFMIIINFIFLSFVPIIPMFLPFHWFYILFLKHVII